MASSQLLIVGSIRLSRGMTDDVRHAMAAMIEASRAEQGCLSYSYAEDVLEPGLIRVTEIWASREALDAHFKSVHLKTWRATWARLGVSDRRLTLYECVAAAPV